MMTSMPMDRIDVIDVFSNTTTKLRRDCDVLTIKRLVIPSNILLAEIEGIQLIVNGMLITTIYFEMIPNKYIHLSPDGYLIDIKITPLYMDCLIYSEIFVNLVSTRQFSYKICIYKTFLDRQSREKMMGSRHNIPIKSYSLNDKISKITSHVIVKSLPIQHLLIKMYDMKIAEYFSYTLEYSKISCIKRVNNWFRSSYKNISKDLIQIINDFIGNIHYYAIPVNKLVEPNIFINGKEVKKLYTINDNEIIISDGVMAMRYIL